MAAECSADSVSKITIQRGFLSRSATEELRAPTVAWWLAETPTVNTSLIDDIRLTYVLPYPEGFASENGGP
jgi:hypothetical protein